MDLVNLVQLVVAREQRKQRDDFKHDASDAPKVHLVAVVAVGEQAFGRTVPPGRDVLSVRLFRVDTTTTAKVCKFHLVLHEENVLGLYVTMENAVTVHVIYGLH